MKNIILCVACVCFLLLFPLLKANAEYTLPYPSAMPGNKIYRITRIVDSLKKYWHFGSMAQIKYHMLLADKYLVEAKTLMEYKQYLLGSDALTRSDAQVSALILSLQMAADQYRDVSVSKQNISLEMQKHTEILDELVTKVPSNVTWSPEKSVPTTILLRESLINSKVIRMELLEKFQ